MSNIVVIGAYPPPNGGISVHIKRLHKLLMEEGYCVNVIDPYSRDDGQQKNGIHRVKSNSIITLLKIANRANKLSPSLIHIHVSAMGKFIYAGLILIFLLQSKPKKILTIHSGTFPSFIKSLNIVKKFLTASLMRKFDAIITVNIEQAEILKELNYKEANIKVIPAYLKPEVNINPASSSLLSTYDKANFKKIIMSGYGVSLYGYDNVLKAIVGDEDLNSNVVLIICTYNTYDECYMEKVMKLMSSIKNAKLFRDLEPEEFSGILQKTDVYIRATDRDGDCVAIREAIHFGVSVMASDVVKRPKECLLFDRSDLDSIRSNIRLALGSNLTNSNEENDNFKKILNIYS